MLNDIVKEKISSISSQVKFGELLSEHSTIKIGGRCSAYVRPANVDEAVKLLQLLKEHEVEICFMGAGSNILFRDGGFDGVVIDVQSLKNCDAVIEENGALRVKAGAGVYINDLVNLTIDKEVTGFECLTGIPGTVGGALSMNAGTHDGTISDTLVSVRAIDKSGKEFVWSKEKIEFGHRKAKYPRTALLLEGEFLLQKGVKKEIEKKVSELRERRKQRHPISFPSLGSIFKNPGKGVSAGQLIEEARLKGVRVGGARISSEHANWIVNENNATSKDVEVLIQMIREKVKESADVVLETEIVVIGKKLG